MCVYSKLTLCMYTGSKLLAYKAGSYATVVIEEACLPYAAATWNIVVEERGQTGFPPCE